MVKSIKKRKLRLKKSVIIPIISIVVIIAIIIIALQIPKSDISDNEETEIKEIAAIVNNEEITVERLNIEYAKIPEDLRSSVSKEYILEQIINQRIMLQEADTLGIKASEAEILDGVKIAIEESKLTEEEFEQQLSEQGLTMEELVALYKDQITILKLLNHTIISKLTITEEEIESNYNENIDQYQAQEGQIRVRHIIVETEEVAEEVLSKLNQGEDYLDLVSEYSIGPSATKGGDLGFFGRKQMVPEFEDAAFGLEIGETSGIVKSDYGYHIIRREADIILLEEVKEEINNALMVQKQKNSLDMYIELLRSKSEVTIY